jgi:hypothetical protein
MRSASEGAHLEDGILVVPEVYAGCTWKSVPSTHMLWRVTASLRASATLADLAPLRAATRVAPALNGNQRAMRVIIT